MEEEHHLKVKKMKDELDLLHLSQAQKSFLNSKREGLEILIHTLQDEIEILEKNKYTQDLNEFDPPSSLEALFKQKQQALKEIKSKLRDIDHLLDQFEEETEETILKREADLAFLIIEHHPAEKLGYEELQKGLNYVQTNQEGVQNLIKLHIHLLDLLHNIFEIRTKVKRQGIFSYIFGRSPNIQISQHLEALNKVSENALDLLKHCRTLLAEDEQALQLVYAEAGQILADLQYLCTQRWNFKKIDHSLKTVQHVLMKVLEQLKKGLGELQKEEKEIQRTIQNWINKYS